MPGKGRVKTAEEIIEICTIVIFTCSVQHAAVNFGQFDQYGYPPNYPSYLEGTPPTNEVSNSQNLNMAKPTLSEIFTVLRYPPVSRQSSN